MYKYEAWEIKSFKTGHDTWNLDLSTSSNSSLGHYGPFCLLFNYYEIKLYPLKFENGDRVFPLLIRQPEEMYGGMREGEWWVNDLYATIAIDVINIEWEEKCGNEPSV